MIEYNIEIQPYRQGNPTDVQSNCNAITFVNGGAATAFISGFPLVAGGTLQISGNAYEIDKTVYKIVFGAGASEVIFVMRKKNKL